MTVWSSITLLCLSQHPLGFSSVDRYWWLCLCLPLLASPRLASGSHVTRSSAKSSGRLMQCLANFYLLLLILFDSFGSVPYKTSLLTLSFHETPSTIRSILVYVPSKLFCWVFVIVQASEPYSRTDSQAAMNYLILSFLESLDFFACLVVVTKPVCNTDLLCFQISFLRFVSKL